MRILIAGKQGQLARAFAAVALDFPGCETTFRGRHDWDLCRFNSVQFELAAISPDVVVNTTAYTAVDQAESEPDEAFKINAEGASNLARAAAASGAAIIQVSTDYVYSGDSTRPYVESDPIGPLNVYGQSKLAGEQAVLDANRRAIVARTAWLFSPWGTNFLKTMLRLGAERDEIRIVGDQIGSPTYAPDLARAIFAVAQAIAQSPNDESTWGTYHIANSGAASWHELATAIFAAASNIGLSQPRLLKIASREHPTRAQRPAYTVLNIEKFCRRFATQMRPWREATTECVQQLLRGANEPSTLLHRS
jgi:dTDP-4-dehydrorhamnose reductase